MKAIHARRLAQAVAVAAVLGTGATAFAQPKTYEGDIVTVDVNASAFTVKATKSGEMPEMAFKVDKSSQLVIDGERRLLGELEKGDHVVVTYASEGTTHRVERAERTRTAVPEMMFSGTVVGVDPKAETFTVRKADDGKVQEMAFHVSTSARLYIGGEPVLLGQLRKGDEVTVGYESTGTMHQAKHVKKLA